MRNQRYLLVILGIFKQIAAMPRPDSMLGEDLQPAGNNPVGHFKGSLTRHGLPAFLRTQHGSRLYHLLIIGVIPAVQNVGGAPLDQPG